MKKTLIFLTAMLLCTTIYAQHRRPTPERKFIYMTSVGYATGLGQIVLEQQTVQNKNFDISVNQLLGYQFNPYFQLGLGAGFDFWKHTAFIPIYLNLTVNFTNTKFVPLFYTNLGYSFKWYVSSQPEKMTHVIHGAKPGLHLNTGLGAKIQIKERLHLFIAADYKVQHSTLQYSVVNPDELHDYSSITTNQTEKKFYHFIGLRIGFMYW